MAMIFSHSSRPISRRTDGLGLTSGRRWGERMIRRRICACAGLMLMAAWPGRAPAQYTQTSMLQYFEASWSTMQNRTPDVFMAGYNAVWVPPPSKGGTGSGSATGSIGYDLFDR